MRQKANNEDDCPNRPEGHLWHQVLNIYHNQGKIDEDLIRKIFESPSVAPLIEEWSPSFANYPDILDPETLWTNCQMTFQVYERFWNEDRDFLAQDLIEDETALTVFRDGSIPCANPIPREETVAAKFKDYYGGNVRYFVHDYLDLRKLSKSGGIPLEEWNNTSWLIRMPEWVNTLCAMLENAYDLRKLSKTEKAFFNLLIPSEAWSSETSFTLVFWLLDTCLPIHYLSVLKSIADKSLTDDGKPQPLYPYEAAFLSHIYSRRVNNLYFEEFKEKDGLNPFSLFQKMEFGEMENFPWENLLEIVVYAAVCDFVDDLKDMLHYHSASKTRKCANCGEFFNYSRSDNLYCSPTCKDTARKHRQREKKRLEDIKKRKLN